MNSTKTDIVVNEMGNRQMPSLLPHDGHFEGCECNLY